MLQKFYRRILREKRSRVDPSPNGWNSLRQAPWRSQAEILNSRNLKKQIESDGQNLWKWDPNQWKRKEIKSCLKRVEISRLEWINRNKSFCKTKYSQTNISNLWTAREARCQLSRVTKILLNSHTKIWAEQNLISWPVETINLDLGNLEPMDWIRLHTTQVTLIITTTNRADCLKTQVKISRFFHLRSDSIVNNTNLDRLSPLEQDQVE